MKLFKKFNFKKLQITGLLAVIMLGVGSMLVGPQTAAIPLPGPYQKDENAVLFGGAPDTGVIKTDYTSGVKGTATDGKKVDDTAGSIKTIYGYKAFGITNSDINTIDSTAKAGSVTSGGDVYIGKQLVATNAITAGRQCGTTYTCSLSTKHTINGTTFYTRPPKASFVSSPLDAYVVMQDGQFKFAILSSCGNPVGGTPKSPTKGTLACTLLDTLGNVDKTSGDADYAFTAKATATNATISQYAFDLGTGHGTQTIKTSATSATSKKVTYAPGTYRVSVKVSGVAKGQFTSAPTPATCTKSFTVPKLKQKTGTLTCNNLTLDKVSTDAATGDVTYKLNAAATPTNATISQYVFTFGNGTDSPQTVKTSANSAMSKGVVYVAGKSYNSIFATVSGKSNTDGKALTAGGAGTKCAAKLNIPTPTPPFQKCVALTPFTLDEQSREVKFTVTTDQGNGSTLAGADFDFSDGVVDTNVKPASTTTVVDTHTFGEDKTYNVNATVHFNTPGGVKDVNCATSVTFTSAPTPTCDGLSLTNPSGRKIDVAISYTPDGATLTSASIDFDDNTKVDTITPDANGKLTDSHTYAADGSYNVTASLLFSVNGKPVTVDGTNCTGAVSFTAPPTCTAPNGKKYPVGSAQCKPTCTAPNGQKFPVNSPHCKPLPPVTTTAITTPLPNTGAGNVIGLFAGVSVVGSVAYRLFLGRRLARR